MHTPDAIVALTSARMFFSKRTLARTCAAPIPATRNPPHPWCPQPPDLVEPVCPTSRERFDILSSPVGMLASYWTDLHGARAQGGSVCEGHSMIRWIITS